MEHGLRCNDIKCRVELRETALVTTCRYSNRLEPNSRAIVAEPKTLTVIYFVLTASAALVSTGLPLNTGGVQHVRHSCRDPTTP